MTEEDSIPGLDFVNYVRVNDYYISLLLVGCIWLVEPDRTIVKNNLWHNYHFGIYIVLINYYLFTIQVLPLSYSAYYWDIL